MFTCPLRWRWSVKCNCFPESKNYHHCFHKSKSSWVSCVISLVVAIFIRRWCVLLFFSWLQSSLRHLLSSLLLPEELHKVKPTWPLNYLLCPMIILLLNLTLVSKRWRSITTNTMQRYVSPKSNFKFTSVHSFSSLELHFHYNVFKFVRTFGWYS